MLKTMKYQETEYIELKRVLNDSFEFLDNCLRVTIPFNYHLGINGTQNSTQGELY